MEFCGNCGAQIQQGMGTCPTCGMSIPAQATPVAQPVAPAATDEARDAEENKLMGILGYLLFFVPLLTGDAKKSPFVKFHTNQGLLVWILSVGYMIISSILRAILGVIFPLHWTSNFIYTRGPVYGILSFVLWLGSVAILAFAVLGILNVLKGAKKPLPVIGGIQIIK